MKYPSGALFAIGRFRRASSHVSINTIQTQRFSHPPPIASSGHETLDALCGLTVRLLTSFRISGCLPLSSICRSDLH